MGDNPDNLIHNSLQLSNKLNNINFYTPVIILNVFPVPSYRVSAKFKELLQTLDYLQLFLYSSDGLQTLQQKKRSNKIQLIVCF